jgi:hypothetical protein
VVWGGRYPVPLKATAFTAQTTSDGRLAREFLSTDPAVINGLFEKLVEIMQVEITAAQTQFQQHRGV